MAIKKYKWFILSLMLGGSLMLIYGLAACFVDKMAQTQLMGLSLFGFLLILVGIFLLRLQSPRKINLLFLKKASFCVLVGLLSLGFLVAINFLAFKYNFRIDLTKSRQHTLLQETKTLLGDLRKEVRITVLHVGTPPKYIEDLLKEYQRASNGNILTEVIDPIDNIGYAAQFGNIIDGSEKKVVVQSGAERRDINFTKNPLTEERLNNAIVRVSRPARYAYFVTGHGEYRLNVEEDKGLKEFSKHLLANNVIPLELLLIREKAVPDNCDLLVIAGPQQHYSEEELNIIRQYLRQGGDALILIEHTVVTTPDKPLTEEQLNLNPSLNELVNEWGIRVGHDIVLDLASHASGDVGSPATRNYLGARAITTGLDYTFYVRPRSLSMLSDRRQTIKVLPFLLTESKEQSWAETNRELEVKFNPETDRGGPVPFGAVIHEPKDDNDHSDTRIIIISDADFLSNAFISSYSNAQMGLNAVQWLTELDYAPIKNSVPVEVQKLNLTSKQKRLVAVILFILPLAVVLIGLLVWLGRLE